MYRREGRTGGVELERASGDTDGRIAQGPGDDQARAETVVLPVYALVPARTCVPLPLMVTLPPGPRIEPEYVALAVLLMVSVLPGIKTWLPATPLSGPTVAWGLAETFSTDDGSVSAADENAVTPA